MLRPRAVGSLIVVGSLAALACAATPTRPADPVADHRVTARWSADDGSVVALNVVVAAGTDPRRLPVLARELRDEHPRGRVLVTFFADTAGPERYVIGHMPAGDEQMVVASHGPGRLATFDFPRPPPPASGR